MITEEVLRDNLSMISLSKGSINDCDWLRSKSLEVFEYSGGDENFETSFSSELRETVASESLLNALRSLCKAALTLSEPRTFSDNHLEATNNVLKTIRNIARRSEDSILFVNNSDVLNVVCETMEVFETNSEICASCFAVFANLSFPSENREKVFELIKTKFIPFLKKNEEDVVVVINVTAFLSNLSNQQTLLNDLGRTTTNILQEITKIHSKNAKVAENAQSAFANLSYTRENVERFFAHDSTSVFELVANLMKLHTRNIVVNEQGLKCVSNFATHTDIKPILIRCGVFSLVQSALTNTGTNAIIAEWGCKTVGALCRNNPATKSAMYHAGAARWILDALRTHGNFPSVVRAALTALSSLANHPPNKLPLVMKDFAAETVVNAMRLNPNHVVIALIGTAALTSLSNDLLTKKPLMKAGVIPCVTLAMRNHISHSIIGEHGCACFWSLAVDKEVQSSLSQDQAALRIIVETMARHSSNTLLILKGLGALENLAIGKVAAKTMVNICIPILTSLIKLNMESNSEVVYRCCNILANLAHFDEEAAFSIFPKYGVTEIAIDVQQLCNDEKCHRVAERLMTNMEGKTLMPT